MEVESVYLCQDWEVWVTTLKQIIHDYNHGRAQTQFTNCTEESIRLVTDR